MDEMKTWMALSDPHQERVIQEAQKLLRWCVSWADQVRPWRHFLEGLRVRGAVEESNEHLVDRLDATVMRTLSGLKQAGVPRPLVPLYVAIWQSAMAIEDSELERQHELAVVLAMIRVQSTARLVYRYNLKPGDKILAAELKRRGLIRR